MKSLSAVSRIVFVFLLSSVASFAQLARPAVYIEPQNGFETYLAAAIAKKNVPVDVVTDQAKSTFALKAAPVEIKSESTGGKIARCLFASCIGIEDKGSVSVQFVETSSSKMLWAYSVNKQKGGSKNEQAMAEAIAKHLKDFIESKSGKEILTASASAPGTAQTDSLTADNLQAEPAMQNASIIVKSTPPGCDINVDGKYMGSTPSTIQLAPGEHQISIEKEELTPWQRTMTVTASGSSTIDATLVKP
jgi:hypothetical protein